LFRAQQKVQNSHLTDATSSAEDGDLEAALLVGSGEGSHMALRAKYTVRKIR
jgi:hypothetical protein